MLKNLRENLSPVYIAAFCAVWGLATGLVVTLNEAGTSSAKVYFHMFWPAMLAMISVQWQCRAVLGADRMPSIMPDETQRDRWRVILLVMMGLCLTMINKWWIELDAMITFCATDFWGGYRSHMPTILFTWALLYAKVRHLLRLWAKESGV